MGTSPYIHDPSHESHVTSHESHGEREKKRKRIMDIEWFVTGDESEGDGAGINAGYDG